MNQLRYLTVAAVVFAACGKADNGAKQSPTLFPREQPNAVANGRPSAAERSGDQPERKDIVVLTPSASTQVVKIIQNSGKGTYLRVSVSDNDDYKLDLTNSVDAKEDYLSESSGIEIVIDKASALLIPVGMVVDFVQENGAAGFTFSSPKPDLGTIDTSISLMEARRGFKTKLARQESDGNPAPEPPPELFRKIRYDAPLGQMTAYISPDPQDGQKHPAIVWITGGNCDTIDDGCWRNDDPANDQSASAYRKAGIVMMFPSLRGGNDNPGFREGFLGEVDDILAAAEYLRQQPYVDADRVYLGGHSSGGTLVLLTAECSENFRAVFSFGPTDDVVGYPPRLLPFALSDSKELHLRAPGRWLHSIRAPVFVFEGAGGNARSLRVMAHTSTNPQVHFYEVHGTNHFGVLAPTNRLVAARILQDMGPECDLAFTEEELNELFVE